MSKKYTDIYIPDAENIRSWNDYKKYHEMTMNRYFRVNEGLIEF